MGWGRFFLLGDYGQQLDIEDQQAAISRARGQQWSKDKTQDEQIEELQAEISDLKLYIGGLCQLLVRKGVVPDDDIAKLAASVYEPKPTDPATTDGVDPTLKEIERAYRAGRDRKP